MPDKVFRISQDVKWLENRGLHDELENCTRGAISAAYKVDVPLEAFKSGGFRLTGVRAFGAAPK